MEPMSEQMMEQIYQEAREAGIRAGNAANPAPMVVQEHENMMDDSSPVKKQWVVPDGPCGFAWIIVKPGTSRFAKFLKARQYGKPDSYQGGVRIWVGDFNQSMMRKEAYAKAFADALRKYGIKASDYSRMD